MNQHLQNILNIVLQDESLTAEQKDTIAKSLKEADKELEITAFKLEKTEKIKRTTAILLEETIEELEQKRKAVEAQNRELEIESSLERVRAQAMSMRQSEELLGFCEILLAELKTLGFTNIRNTQIVITTENKDFFINYQFSDYGVTGIKEIHYKGYYLLEEFVNNIKRGNDYFVMKELSGDELEKWKEDRIKNGDLDDPKLNEASSLYYYWYSTATGALGISAFKPITDEQLKILQRFRNVFELTYRRFMDIEKAKAQAREAKIEAALERARTQSMLMQHSSELSDTLQVFHQQLQLFGINSDFSYLWLPDEENDKHLFWAVWEEDKNGATIFKNNALTYPLDRDEPYTAVCLADWKSGVAIHAYKVAPAGVKDYFAAWGELFSSAEKLKAEFFPDGFSYVEAYMKYGCFGIAISRVLTDEEKQLLRRFTMEFERAYTRFLDLQKAEAQARESQIQLAMERVRARTMAMQHSDELSETATVLFEQLNQLGEAPERTFIGVIDEVEHVIEIWATLHGGNQMNTLLKGEIDEPFVMNRMYTAWKEQKKSIVIDLQGHELEGYFQYLKGKGTPVKRDIFGRRRLVNIAFFSKGMLGIITTEPRTAEAIVLYERFAGVFDLTYTRFLDLQKAEAQAREAKIELGLERVRARAMAMQKSDELSELVDTVFKELTKLDFALTWCIINIIDEPSLSNTVWAANPDINKAPESYHMLFEDYPFHHAMMKGWKERKTKSVYTLEGDEKRIYDDYLFSETEFKRTPETAQAASRAMEKYVVSFSFSNFGGLQTVGDVPLSDANLDILSRFGKVFDLTYTRFNDLKQAEEQARESQIQLALERVRARTMAMQKSDELMETAVVLFNQLYQLGEYIERTIIGVVNEEERIVDFWATRPDGSQMDRVQKFPIDEPIVMQKVYDAWQQQKKSIVIDLRGEELESYFQFLKARSTRMNRESFGERRVENFVFFSKGFLGVISADPTKPADVELYERFAAVFDQTYTRFLDLQKAEAQVREAQIESRLERVRSRTMGMQKSEELKEVIQVVYEQFVHLNIHVEHTGFIMDYKERNDMHIWLADKHAVPFQVTIPYFDCAHWNSFNEAKGKGIDFFSNKLSFEEKNKFYLDLFKLVPGVPEETLEYYFNCPGLAISTVLLENVGLYIENFSGIPYSKEENDTLMRFGKVFQQTYTRFLDLQKAEVQGREAQIELALERVRARTMAMQKSDELREAVLVIYQQLQELDFGSQACNIIIIDKDTGDEQFWVSGFTQEIFPESYHVPRLHHHYQEDQFTAWRNGVKYAIYEYTGAEKKKFDKIFFTQTDFRNIPEQAKQFMIGLESIKLSTAFTAYGSLQVLGPEALSEEKATILNRFAKVFEQTYTRFLDLQKAEAQAREAQIEAALEKVRSRSLAMHNAKELGDVVTVIVEKLKDLGVVLDANGVILCTYFQHSKDVMHWIVSPDYSMAGSYLLPYFDHPIFNAAWQSKENGDEYFSRAFSVAEKNSFFEYAFEHSDYRYFPDELKQWIFQNDQHILSFAWQKNSAILIPSHTGVLPSEEDIAILKRFAKVFEQSYVRFLDLQKAEAQAKESQIQLALERVRARTMAMQHSDELKDAAAILFQQARALGVPAYSCGYNIWEKDEKEFTSWMSTQDGSDFNAVLNIPLTEDANFIRFAESRRKGEQFFVLELRGERMQEHYEYLKTIPAFKAYFEYAVSVGFDLPETQIHHLANFSHGNLLFITLEPCPEFHDVFKRFAAVFEQTYTRFLDLQKAEAQAREAQIETALEKVRSRSLAMHKSEELQEVVHTVFEKLKELEVELYTAIIIIFTEGSKDMVWWLVNKASQQYAKILVPYRDNYYVKDIFDAKQKGTDFFSATYSREEKNDLFYHLFENTEFKYVPEQQKQFLLESDMATMSVALAKYTGINITSYTKDAFSEKENEILKRFAKVFDQAYTRFLDLQKAEAQAREAQIEAALERVRSRAMAMQGSDELNALIGTVFTELTKLELVLTRSVIFIYEPDGYTCRWWMANSESPAEPANFLVNYDEQPFFQAYRNGWQERNIRWVYELQGEDKVKTDDFLFKETELSRLPGFVIDGMRAPATVWLSASFNNFGCLTLASLEPLPEEHFDILLRFARVFDLTYTRFNDLKKAEEQAREALIEAGLERVRSRTMAMHSSEDVSVATATMFNELNRLNIQYFRGGILNIREDQTMEVWSINTLDDGTIVRAIGDFDMKLHPFWQQLYAGWVNKDDFFSFNMIGKDKEDYIRILNARPDYLPNGLQQLPDCYVQAYYFGAGAVWCFCLQPHSEDNKQVMKRFASGFSLTFRRYQDLRKAEAQAREATIEAALEKVRGKAMAMHNSNDLSVTASMVFTELRKLGINPIRCGVSLQTKESRKNLLYYSIPSPKGDTLSLAGSALLSGHPVLSEIYDSWLRNEDYFPVLKGESLINYYQTLKQAGFDVPVSPSGHAQYGYYIAFSEGMFYGWVEKSLTESEIKILKRFASVIDLTFRRYIELQKSEANAKEAVKQAALDRIRADIASMRTVADLDRITPLIWNELNILGIPFIRCGVFIMDDSQQLIHTFLSSPDGNAIAAFHLPYDTPGNLSKVLSHWNDHQNYVDHWDESAFTELADILVKQGAIASPGQYLDTIPHGGFHLHFLPFLQGMLYVGNTAQLSDEDIDLIQSVADAFSTAYARYEDFNKLETAKQTVDKTLVDLKQAQTQLVQSEKMASLGELTAGIAHEIQNPLNFVNNFSEVSNELLDEMITELGNGTTEDAIAIANDVKQNLEKILHHGKRADGIVKGMLQHSRSTTAVKELTDINKLADEYLRLAYHGLRAKDKSFNANLKTDFDASIGSISIIPQDIGRAVLNLITNAFYVVGEKNKQTGNGYEPTVSVSTKKMEDRVEIRVADNGNGIPPKVLDKVFQPFFTTKPTGQGTGLGLSLSYDVVKAHGGELKVTTTEGEGSEFIIQLPVV